MEPLPYSPGEMAPLPTTLESPSGASKPLGALPDDETPVKRRVKKSRLIHLSTEQILAHRDGANAVGAAIAARPVVGRERRALSSLLSGLARWAESTEPRLTLSAFVVDMQRAGKCRILRRELAERRTLAFRQAVAGRGGGSPEMGDEGPPGPADEMENAEQMEPADWGSPVRDAAAAGAGEGDAPRRVAQALDMDIDPADAMEAQGPMPPEEDEYELDLLREMEMGSPEPPVDVKVPEVRKASPTRKRAPPVDEAANDGEEKNGDAPPEMEGRARKLRKLADMEDPFDEATLKAHSALVAEKFGRKAAQADVSETKAAGVEEKGHEGKTLSEPETASVLVAAAAAEARPAAPEARPSESLAQRDQPADTPNEEEKSAVERALAATALSGDDDDDDDELDVLREFEEGG